MTEIVVMILVLVVLPEPNLDVQQTCLRDGSLSQTSEEQQSLVLVE
jgi:hypothetical protein